MPDSRFEVYQLTRLAEPPAPPTVDKVQEYFAFLEALKAELGRRDAALLAHRFLQRQFPELDESTAADVWVRWSLSYQPLFILTRRNQ